MNKALLLAVLLLLPCAYAAVPQFSVSTNSPWAGATNSIYDLTIISFVNTSANKVIDVKVPTNYDIYVPNIPGYVLGTYDIAYWNGTGYDRNEIHNITVLNTTRFNASGKAIITLSGDVLKYTYPVGVTSVNGNTTRTVSSYNRGIINNPPLPGQYNWDANVTFAAGLGPMTMPGNKAVYLLGQTTVMNFNTTYANTYFNYNISTIVHLNQTSVVFNSNNVSVTIHNNQTNIFNNVFNNRFNFTFANAFSNFFTNAFHNNLTLNLRNNVTTIDYNDYNMTFNNRINVTNSNIVNNRYNFSIVSSPKFNITVVSNLNNPMTLTFDNNFTNFYTNAFHNNLTLNLRNNYTFINNPITNNAFHWNTSNYFTNMFTNSFHNNVTLWLRNNVSTIVYNGYNITTNNRINVSTIVNNRYNFSIVSSPSFNVTMNINNLSVNVVNNQTNIHNNGFNFTFNNMFSNMFTNSFHNNLTVFLRNNYTFINNPTHNNYFNLTINQRTNTTIFARSNVTIYTRNNFTNIYNNRYNFTITPASVRVNITNQFRYNTSMSCPAPVIPACPAIPAAPACPKFNVTVINQQVEAQRGVDVATPADDSKGLQNFVLAMVLCAIAVMIYNQYRKDKTDKIEEPKEEIEQPKEEIQDPFAYSDTSSVKDFADYYDKNNKK